MQETMWGLSLTLFILTIVLLSIWESIWKGIGLWKSAKKGNLIWFICMFLFNTVGILPILYIYVFSKSKSEVKSEKIKKSRR
jgi:uncharacterized membrane protein YagU involved in acid resistance